MKYLNMGTKGDTNYVNNILFTQRAGEHNTTDCCLEKAPTTAATAATADDYDEEEETRVPYIMAYDSAAAVQSF